METNIYTLQAGRDTDALIAEHLLGYRRVKVGKDGRGEYGGTDVLLPPTISERESWNMLPKVGPVHLAWFTPQWSTNLGNAMQLWGILAGLGWQCTLVHRQFERDPDDHWMFHGVNRLTRAGKLDAEKGVIFVSFSMHADMPTLAIARGALQAAKAAKGKPQ